MSAPAKAGFSVQVARWQRIHGRQGLPWQSSRDPYRVWLSEVMLQQTQVGTVLRYYDAFLERFPDVEHLANASEDDVLALWSGLGYYSRARNLHRCAQEIVRDHQGRFPTDAAGLQRLPGIGRSTAAAIAAFCFGERVPILDGNVKRVLGRVFAWDRDLSTSEGLAGLWRCAEELVPEHPSDMTAYTQGMMDIGATICLHRAPSCLLCPVAAMCSAYASGQPERFPMKSKRMRRSAETLWLLIARRQDGAVWLEKRPSKGVWGGLYAPPALGSEEALLDRIATLDGRIVSRREPVLHPLTHKDLTLRAVDVELVGEPQPDGVGTWFDAARVPSLGLPTPIRKLLQTPV